MIEALMESPFYGLADRADLAPGTLDSFVSQHTCDLCGASFAMYCNEDDYCYQVREKRHNHRQLFFCSYHCWRRFQLEQAERIQEKRGAPRLQWRRTREGALERKAHCERKIAEYKAAAESGVTAYERNVARTNVRNWKERLKEVDDFLEGREYDDEE